MKRTLLLAGLALAALAACEEPPVHATQDAAQNRRASRLEGDVVVSSRARGNVVLFLYDLARPPPPPQGTGRPVAFAVLPAAQMFGAALADLSDPGPFTARFTFSQLAAGRYQVRAFLDRDECAGQLAPCRPPDFIPWYSVTAEANALDLGGGAVDPATRGLRTFEIAEPELQPVLSAGVSIADAAAFPADRPAFAVVSGNPRLVPAEGQKAYELAAASIDQGLVRQRAPAFLVRFVDEDGDGTPDDANKDGVPDLWPKVVVRKLAAINPLADENDLDRNGVLDGVGEDYEHVRAGPSGPEVVAKDGQPDAVVLAAGLDATELIPRLLDATGKPRMTPLPLTRLRLVVRPQAFDVSNPSAPAPLHSVPSGSYAITLVQFTGQTWRVPNELSPVIAGQLGLPLVETQGFALMVP